MAIAIVEELWARIRAAIDDKITAATAASESAVAAKTAAEAAATEAQGTAANAAAVAAANVATELQDLTDRAETAATTATTAVASEVEKLKGEAPEAFDTLGEIAAELAANETERSALTNSIAVKADKAYVDSQLAALPTGGRNLFLDPSFENGTDHTAAEVPDAFSGQHVSRLDAGRWTGGGVRSMFYTGGEARTYEMVYHARAVNFPAGYAGNGTLALRFKRFDGDQVYIKDFFPPSHALLQLKDLTSEWVQFRAVYTVNDDHMYLAPYFVVSGGAELAGAYVDVDEVFVADVTEKEGLRTHTHTSADITDLPPVTVWVREGDVPTRMANGNLSVPAAPGYNNAATSKTYVDTQVATKANASHTHETADIGDARTWMGRSGDSEAVIRTDGGGWFYIGADPSHDNHPTRKAYVDAQVATKANASHTHTLSQISGVPNAATPMNTGDTIATRTAQGNLAVSTPTDGLHAANKMYVDGRIPWVGTRAQYNAITSKDANRLYVITGA